MSIKSKRRREENETYQLCKNIIDTMHHDMNDGTTTKEEIEAFISLIKKGVFKFITDPDDDSGIYIGFDPDNPLFQEFMKWHDDKNKTVNQIITKMKEGTK